MSDWSGVLNEIRGMKSPFDEIRGKYLRELCNYTDRNIIAYYSGWLNKPNANNLDINDSDMVGLTTCVHELDCKKGLDLILHTPGGSPTATEGIVSYLRSKFNNDVRVIVPQMAMSAGTMLACSAKVVLMGKHSSLGPIDPQFNGIPAYNIKREYEEAKKDLLANPASATYWAIKLGQYPAAFMYNAIDAINLSSTLLSDWLGTCMFDKNSPDDIKIISNIVSSLNEHDNNKVHGRHLNAEACKKIGLKIEMLEDDDTLQDLVLSLHHAYMISISETPAVKIIENQNQKLYVITTNIKGA